MPENQSVVQKKIAFAQSEHVEAALIIFRDCIVQKPLVGENEYETVVNAVTLDAQSDMIQKFINSIDMIKKGGLHNQEK